jgi:hypothetical protein
MKKNSLTEKRAAITPASDVFVVNGPSDHEAGVGNLIGLKGKEDLKFNQSDTAGLASGLRD